MPWPSRLELVQLACTHPTLVEAHHYQEGGGAERRGVASKCMTEAEARAALARGEP